MKTFLKILLAVALVILAIKLGPLFIVGAFIGLFIAGVLGVVTLSLFCVLLMMVAGIAVALMPIWIPVLAVYGLVKLFRREKAATPAAPVEANVPPVVPA